jgi:hypothetical protein
MRIGSATTRAATTLALVVLTGFSSPETARAGVISHGPIFAFGASEIKDLQYFIPTFGLRVELAPARGLGRWMHGIGTDLTFVLEAVGAAVTGDDSTFEAQLLPLARFEPRTWQDHAWLPFLELGIGVVYTGLDDIGLGDNVLFSNNVGAGVSLKLPQPFPFKRSSVGYRFRHASHAGLLGDKNVGSNTHYLTITFE